MKNKEIIEFCIQTAKDLGFKPYLMNKHQTFDSAYRFALDHDATEDTAEAFAYSFTLHKMMLTKQLVEKQSLRKSFELFSTPVTKD